MEKIKVEKKTLIDALVKNRAEHKRIYDEAFQGFKEEAIETAGKILDAAKDAEHLGVIRLSLGLTPPANNLKDYDRAIGMLEMSIDNEVEITSLEFQHYIQDDWGWKNSFLLSNTKYLKH